MTINLNNWLFDTSRGVDGTFYNEGAADLGLIISIGKTDSNSNDYYLAIVDDDSNNVLKEYKGSLTDAFKIADEWFFNTINEQNENIKGDSYKYI